MKEPLEIGARAIMDSIADGVFTVDHQWRITSFNRAAEKITGIKKDEAVGRSCWEVFRASICEGNCALSQTMKSTQPIINKSIYIINSEGDRIPISISTAILHDQAGNVTGGVETFRDLSVEQQLRKELQAKHSFFDIISKNSEMQRLFSILELISESATTVLIEGESGTGKELFAKAIHSLSPRKNRPLVTVNSGALPDTLLESELFGYKAGAFTDAKKDKPGRIAMAKGGSLFLDEIGDISPMLQVRLLRVLQEKTFEPLGGTESEKADVRIIAATNKNLEKMVKENLFREDLYYRLNVMKLELPPLRRRREDIPVLAEHFIKKFCRLEGKEPVDITANTMAILMTHDYPGNVRELENIIEYAFVISKGGIIEPQHLPDNLKKARGLSREAESQKGSSNVASLKEIEKNYIIEELKQNNWSRKATAKKMGIHTTTLWRKIKRLNIEIP